MKIRALATTYEPLPLPYAPNALEPAISAETINLHTTLYANYATNFGRAQDAFRAASTAPLERDALNNIAFQGSGYILHGVYFYNMRPGTTSPGTNTTTLINTDFTSLEEFRRLFTESAVAIPGPGWMVWGWSPRLKQSIMQSVYRHQDNTLTGVTPVLVLDVWEHAYLLDYLQDRAAYVNAWWPLINWEDVEQRLVTAMQQGEASVAPAPPAPIPETPEL